MSVVVSVNVNASLYKVICALLLLIVAFPCWQCVLHVNNNNNECICKVQNKWFSDALHHRAGIESFQFPRMCYCCIITLYTVCILYPDISEFCRIKFTSVCDEFWKSNSLIPWRCNDTLIDMIWFRCLNSNWTDLLTDANVSITSVGPCIAGQFDTAVESLFQTVISSCTAAPPASC